MVIMNFAMATEETLGQRVLALRKELGKTQVEMAKAVGVATATWQKIERDEGLPAGETLMQFEKLGINPGWVLAGLGPKHLKNWRDGDADAELFFQIGAMIEEAYESQSVAIPPRGVAKTARAIFAEIANELTDHSGPDEIEALINLYSVRLRRQIAEAKVEPGSGKRSAS